MLAGRRLSKLLVRADRLLFLAALNSTGAARRALCTALLANDWHFRSIDGAAHSPVSIIGTPYAGVWVVQIANKIAFILLGSDDPFHRSQLAGRLQEFIPRVLGGAIVHLGLSITRIDEAGLL